MLYVKAYCLLSCLMIDDNSLVCLNSTFILYNEIYGNPYKSAYILVCLYRSVVIRSDLTSYIYIYIYQLFAHIIYEMPLKLKLNDTMSCYANLHSVYRSTD